MVATTSPETRSPPTSGPYHTGTTGGGLCGPVVSKPSGEVVHLRILPGNVEDYAGFMHR